MGGRSCVLKSPYTSFGGPPRTTAVGVPSRSRICLSLPDRTRTSGQDAFRIEVNGTKIPPWVMT